MGPSFVVSLLLLFLFLTRAQGIRLEKGSFGALQNKHDEESNLLKRNNSSEEEVILCKDQQCKGMITNRKLFTSAASVPHAISKNVKNEGNEGQPQVNGNTINEKEEEIKVNKQEEELLHDQELVDITDMDYSPARRKTPIHN